MLASCRRAAGPDLSVARTAAITFGKALLVGLALALVPAGVCALLIEGARRDVEHGRTADALRRLDAAATIVPLIRMNADVVAQQGLLADRLGRDTPEAALHRARVLLLRGHWQEAEAMLESVAGDPMTRLGTRLEAIRYLLRHGIRQLNSGETNVAIATFEAVLAHDPCDLKADYALQLAYLRSGRSQGVPALAAKARAIYAYFNTIDKLPVLGAVQENVMYAAFLRHDLAATQAAHQLLMDPGRVAKEP
jgi:tetratricopeptide (TPR) repeat protein